MKQRLTAEESAELIKMGVDPSKASECMLDLDYDSEVIPREDVWEENGRLLANVNDEVIDVDRKILSKEYGDFDHAYENDNPIFTLADIIALVPKRIAARRAVYTLEIGVFDGSTDWYVRYTHCKLSSTLYDLSSFGKELIDALFDVLVKFKTTRYKIQEL